MARELRDQQLDASTASVVEASRLATALAAVRGRPSVGLTELDDAAESVLCEGSRVPLRLVHDSLVVGHDLGTVPERAPMVPLAADLARQQRATRLKPAAQSQTVTLDLRRESQLARSVLLHRLRVLGVDWGTEADAGRSTGTFKEAWELEWRPELAVAVIEAGLYGTTIEAAAAAKVSEQAEQAADLATLGRLVSECLLADLPDGLRSVVASLEERTAKQHDVLALLGAVEPLARTVRYGDVRGVDVGGVATVLRALVVRACVGLPGGVRRARRRRRDRDARGDRGRPAGRRAPGPGGDPHPLGGEPGGGGRPRPRARLGGGPRRPAAPRRRAPRPGRGGRPDEPAAVGRRRRPTTRPRGSTGSCRGSRCCWCTTPRCSPSSTSGWRASARRPSRTCCRCCGVRSPATNRPSAPPSPRQVARLGRAQAAPAAGSSRIDLDRARPAVARVAALLGWEVPS